MNDFSWQEGKDDRKDETFPNGYTRVDYYEAGFSEGAIEYFGLDKPVAPGPNAAVWEIGDFMDGDYDGEIDW